MVKTTDYTSETTEFIKDILEKNPNLKAKQKQLRDTWWDKNSEDVCEDRKLEQTDLKHPAYPYF